MKQYIIREVQNVNDYREGYTVEAKSLRAAKMIASKRKAFFNTILLIEGAKHGGLIAKKINGRWE